MLAVSLLIAASFYNCTSKNNGDIASFLEGYELAWSDEFEGESLDTFKWAFREDNKHKSIQRAENISVKGGKLVLDLKVFNEPVEGKFASGAGVVTRERFRYGYYEVKAKIGDGVDNDNDGKTDEGWHHSFWAMAADVLPTGNVTTTFPDFRRTEIDCYENCSEHIYHPAENTLNVFTQHVIIWNEKGKETGRRPKPPTDITAIKDFNSNDWHTYGFEWNKDSITFYVDRNVTKIAQYPATEFEHDSINVWLTAIAANWNADDQEKSEAQYEYFKFYKKNN